MHILFKSIHQLLWYENPIHSSINSNLNVSTTFAFSETVRCFVSELKRALIKDIQKKMVETYAFYLYEQWWTEQDKKYKDRVS
jgi:uncharacterized membrane protein